MTQPTVAGAVGQFLTMVPVPDASPRSWPSSHAALVFPGVPAMESVPLRIVHSARSVKAASSVGSGGRAPSSVFTVRSPGPAEVIATGSSLPFFGGAVSAARGDESDHGYGQESPTDRWGGW
ncbi:hypothetical protein ACH4MG_25705 [Streptomyces sp. NPDC017454]|uniref:hypothetical protein n=1 Tax=Streptomyces sp. NPDC017454 TaxID=3364997 RepID=UPI003796F320